VQGTAKVVRGNEEVVLTEEQSTYIPLGAMHRLENIGSYLGEEDIVRFEYGRK
jgi:mannose-1-phosphate guanylyltransferase / mannose-6-phosphate isomerase